MSKSNNIRDVLLQVIAERANSHTLQTASVLHEAAQRLELGHSLAHEQALLTAWSDMFRMGYLAWGYNISNPEPPFCHLTESGRRVLAALSRDPANPAGYLAYLSKRSTLEPIAESYIQEALDAYSAGCFKASAVMIGAAAESMVGQVLNFL